MQEREILIANNRDQTRYRIVTDASTLGELQDAITRNENVYRMSGGAWVSNPTPIDFEGLTFTEGITKTQLLDRSTQLPTNVEFKGARTNNLVMLLTNTVKNIQSGMAMSRKEAYAEVKRLGITGTITEGEGINWTRVKTSVLETYIYAAQGKNNNAAAIEEARAELKEINAPETEDLPKEEETSKPVTIKTATHAKTVEWLYTGVKSMTEDFSLDASDVEVLADLLTELSCRLKETEPSVSDEDIDEMLNSL